MSRITGNVADMAPRSALGVVRGGLGECWMCQTGVSARASFCHSCGTIQPVRSLNHFERLGLDCRFDIDRQDLEARTAALLRVFRAQTLSGRGPRQRQLASEHMAAVTEASATLGDPVRRAEYLLTLMQDGGTSPTIIALDDVEALKADLKMAADGAAIDRVANQAGRGVEACIRDLSAAFRTHELAEVTGILARLTQLEALSVEARTRRVNA